MQNDRRCAKCGEPLARKKRETNRDWAKRRYCNRSCYVGDRNSNPIWKAFAEQSVRRENGCIEWIGLRDKKGYGRFSSHGGEVLVHRLAFQMHFGDQVKGWHVLHRCDNRACINPHHLFLGTNDDNMADMVRKGRASRRFGKDNPNWRHGKNCTASPKRREIADIRKERANG